MMRVPIRQGKIDRPLTHILSPLRPTIGAVFEQVARAYNLTPEQLRGVSRTKALAWPRQVGYWLACSLEYPYGDVGKEFRKHRGTVQHGYQAVEDFRRIYPDIKRETDAILKRLWSRP